MGRHKDNSLGPLPDGTYIRATKIEDLPTKLTGLANVQTKLAQVYEERCANAFEHYTDAVRSAGEAWRESQARSTAPLDLWRDAANYWLDFTQRSVLFWDTLRERGNNWIEHEKAGKPPLLDFDWEIVADGRKFEQPTNYALVRIIPPEGIKISPDLRPFVIIDPRAGHGPGIGGFQAGFAGRRGTQGRAPGLFRHLLPRTGTRADPCRCLARRGGVPAHCRQAHPNTGKPVVIGNCQGGWATMLVGALDPELVGPLVINGAPMSYWAGNDGENPMRYAGGILGGIWPALLASDLGGG